MTGTVSIFDGCGTDEQFRYCTLLEVSTNDGLPSKLCQLCSEHMKIAYDFRFQATYAENFLYTVLKKKLRIETEQENVDIENIDDENMQDIGKLLSNRADDFEPVAKETISNNNRSVLSAEVEQNSLQSDDHFSNAFVCSSGNQNIGIFEEKALTVSTYKNQYQTLAYSNNSVEILPKIRAYVELKKNLLTDERNLSIETNHTLLNNVKALESVFENAISDSLNSSASDTTVIESDNLQKSKKQNSKTNKKKINYRKENREKIECNICGTTFTHINSLKQHLMKHSGEKPFKCEFCEKCFARKTILTIHRRLHTGDRPYRCDECIRTFVTKEALNRHKERDHNDYVEANFLKNKIAFICSICYKARCSKYSLAAHMRTHSVSGEELDSSKIFNDAAEKVDQQSNKAETAKPQQNNHLSDDAESKPLSTFKYCKICQQGFSSKWELVAHQEKHRVAKLFECDVCQRTFDKKYMLLSHLQLHEGAEILIKECIQKPVPVLEDAGKSTVAREASDNENIDINEDDIPLLQRRKHLKIISKKFSSATTTSISKNDCLKCQPCRKAFANSATMQVHIMKHLGDRSFECKHCHKFFSRTNMLEIHHRLYTSSEKSYKCKLCETV